MEKFIDQLTEKDIRIINPLWSNSQKEEVAGWHMAAATEFRKAKAIEWIRKLIRSESLPYYVEDFGYRNEFMIYIK